MVVLGEHLRTSILQIDQIEVLSGQTWAHEVLVGVVAFKIIESMDDLFRFAISIYVDLVKNKTIGRFHESMATTRFILAQHEIWNPPREFQPISARIVVKRVRQPPVLGWCWTAWAEENAAPALSANDCRYLPVRIFERLVDEVDRVERITLPMDVSMRQIVFPKKETRPV